MKYDQCEVKRCRQAAYITYSAGPDGNRWAVCERHYDMHIDGKIDLKDDNNFREKDCE